MNESVPFGELEVVGFIGTSDREDAPLRLSPVFGVHATGKLLVPPMDETAEGVRGELIDAAHWEDLVDGGEAERLPTPVPARQEHTLWLGPLGLAYERSPDAEAHMGELAVEAVRTACSILDSPVAGELLFAALRARQTRTANALLSIHFQLTGQDDQLAPLHQDLAALGQTPADDVDRRQLACVVDAALDDKLTTAIAEELRRAESTGGELAERLLEKVDEITRAAGDRTPPLGWSLACFAGPHIDPNVQAAE
jgi:hypothetical protein